MVCSRGSAPGPPLQLPAGLGAGGTSGGAHPQGPRSQGPWPFPPGREAGPLLGGQPALLKMPPSPLSPARSLPPVLLPLSPPPPLLIPLLTAPRVAPAPAPPAAVRLHPNFQVSGQCLHSAASPGSGACAAPLRCAACFPVMSSWVRRVLCSVCRLLRHGEQGLRAWVSGLEGVLSPAGCGARLPHRAHVKQLGHSQRAATGRSTVGADF